MRWRKSMQVLNSRVARRLLGLVVLLVLVPVILTALIAYESINRQVVSNAEQELRQSAKSYLVDVIGRLRIADHSLRNLALSLGEAQAAKRAAPASMLALGLVDVVTGSPAVPYESLPEAVQAVALDHQSAAADDGKTRLVFVPSGSEPAGVYLVRSWADATDGRYVAARVDPAFLWESASLMPFGHYYCVTTAEGMKIFCPNSEDFAQSAVFGTGATQDAEGAEARRFDANGTTYLASRWGGAVTIEFGIMDLVVTVAQRERDLKSPLYSFVSTVPPALGIATLTAILLAMIVIRRRMKPLDQLTAAAAQLARGDFSTVVRVDADDEFLGLARMFDDMRARLGQQFSELAILSNVDQAILRMESLATIIERSTPEIIGAFPGRLVGTILLDQAAPGRVRVFSPGAAGTSITRKLLPASVLMAWEADCHGNPFLADEHMMRLLDVPESHGARVEVVPIRDENVLIGFLCAETGSESDPVGQPHRLLVEFSGRLAVAAANIRHRERLYAIGHYDELTGLPNRQLLRERLQNAVRTGSPGEAAGYLLFIDLDGFKQVNDAEGHPVGDALLCDAAQRIAGCLRDEDSVFRLGGDEFTVMLNKPCGRDQAVDVGNRIVASLRKPYRLVSLEHFLSASIGVVEIVGGEATDSYGLVRDADIAMYAAKDNGGNQVVFFESAMQAVAGKRVAEENALRAAVDNGELTLYFQPQLETQSGRVAGAEALLRWNRPGMGVIGPAAFIQLAEGTGMIRNIGLWALRDACQRFVRWMADGVQLDEISVNCSMRQLKDEGFVSDLERVLAETGMPAGALMLEITESLMAEDLVRAAGQLTEIRRLGVRISIDDFGTGYSSLGYLRNFPVDELKIDRSFFVGVPGNSQADSVIESIIDLGSRLGKRVVAEGIETLPQYEYLRRTQCPRVQGYLFSPPVAEEKFLAFVSARNARGLRSVA